MCFDDNPLRRAPLLQSTMPLCQHDTFMQRWRQDKGHTVLKQWAVLDGLCFKGGIRGGVGEVAPLVQSSRSAMLYAIRSKPKPGLSRSFYVFLEL